MILVHQFSGISKNGWKYCREHMTQPYLSNAAYDICGVILQFKESNQDNVAKALKMDKSSVAKIVNKCVLDGLIERQINPDNRREYILRLTEKGKITVQELIDLVEQWQQEALSALDEKEQEVFLQMLEKIKVKTNLMADQK